MEYTTLGDVGLVANLIHRMVDLFVNEDQLPEIRKRRELAALKKECRDALVRNDWAALAVATQRLRDAATKP